MRVGSVRYFETVETVSQFVQFRSIVSNLLVFSSVFFSRLNKRAGRVMSFNDAVLSQRWLAKNKCPMSNLSMDGWKGGKLHVPPDQYDAFLACYANGLRKNEKMYVIELRTSPLFKWHADLDILLPNEISQSQTMQILPIIQAVLAEYLCISGKNKLKLLGLSVESKKKEDGTVKSGLHIIAPNIVVSVEDCVAIQELCIQRLEGSITLINTWADAFDTSVYKGSGLRMLGSRKMETCKCGETGETRRIDSGRPYSVSFVMDGDGKFNDDETNLLKRNVNLAVRMSSIRAFGNLQTTTRPQKVVAFPLKRQRATPEDAPDDLDIAGLLAHHLHPSFASIEIANMKRVPRGVVFSVKGCKFCLNVEREHSSSNIYVFLSTDGELSQRCHCPKYSCSSYRSPSISVTSALMKKCGLVSSNGLPANFQ